MPKTTAILIARLIFAFVFGMAAAFKFAFVGIDATAGQIAGAGFPIPHVLAWVAAFFEVGLALGFLTGVYFTEVAIVSIAYVLFLAFSFHGPGPMGRQPDGVRLLHRSLHVRRRAAVRGGPRARATSSS